MLITAIFASKKTEASKDDQPAPAPKAQSNNTDTESLEGVEVESDVNLSVSSEDEEVGAQTTRAALVEFVCHRLGKNLNKGE
jgi:hypothetical protein